MCGITAYLGVQEALSILINGLKRLEYRGYDSAGIALLQQAGFRVVKRTGKVSILDDACKTATDLTGTLGIAHTRWATHGQPSDANAHPHVSGDGAVALVHNGVIENYDALKKLLIEKGHTFRSETDTEVIVELIAEVRSKNPGWTVEEVVQRSLAQLDGAFGLAIMFTSEPGLLIGARRGSPLILGVGGTSAGPSPGSSPTVAPAAGSTGSALSGIDPGAAAAGGGGQACRRPRAGSIGPYAPAATDFILASDTSAIVEHTQNVIYLKENHMVVCRRGEGYTVCSLANEQGDMADPEMHELVTLEMTLESIEKGGFEHFMLKEIFEQPGVLRNCMRGRVLPQTNSLRLGGLEEERVQTALREANRLIICACGTSFHAGLVGEYMIEELAKLNVEVQYASEFRYRSPLISDKDVVLAISQSGETADTLAAIKLAKEHGALTLGLVNVVGSTIARETDAGVYLHVGPEIGVASTKAFTGQSICLAMLAVVLGRMRGQLTEEQVAEKVQEMSAMPDQVAKVLAQSDNVVRMSREFRFAQSFLFLGRGYNFPVAMEGALKLKEISYIHAEGYAAAEMKHGPIALIDPLMPVVMIMPRSDHIYPKVKSNLQEVLTRRGTVIAITEEDNEELETMCESVLYIPAGVPEWLSPLVTVVPLQLLSYHIANLRGCEIDKPRNLAKSVVVE